MNASKLLALGLAALVSAGCLGGSSPSTTHVSTTAPAAEAEPAAIAPPATPSPPPALRETPIAYSGKTGTAACAHAETVAHCAWADKGSERNHAIPLEAKPISLKGTVEYTTSAPGTFGVFVCVEHEEGLF